MKLPPSLIVPRQAATFGYFCGKQGFTLVEVVIALGICSFALISLASLVPVSLDAARNSLDISMGTKAVQQVASELSQSRFTRVTALAGAPVERSFDYNALPTTHPKNIYFTVKASVDNSKVLPGATAASPSLAQVVFEVKTPRGSLLRKSVITIPDMGY